MMRCAAVFALVMLTVLPRIGAQDAAIVPRVKPPASDAAESILDRRADLRIDTTEVRIPVSVTHQQSGKVITGLEITNFEVFEDKVRQEILSFTSEDAPISVGVVFDASGSMGSKLSK